MEEVAEDQHERIALIEISKFHMCCPREIPKQYLMAHFLEVERGQIYTIFLQPHSVHIPTIQILLQCYSFLILSGYNSTIVLHVMSAQAGSCPLLATGRPA
jgi:hypothetical protein